MIGIQFLTKSILIIALVFVQRHAVAQQASQQPQLNYLVKEPIGKPKALLILLPGLGNPPESVFDDTDLETSGAQYGLVTIVPKVQTNIILDDVTFQTIMSAAKDALQRYAISNKHIVIGGFSAGGSTALLVAERANKENAAIKPRGVVAIDPPVDLAHLWTTYTKSLQRNPSSPSAQEASTLTKYMQDLTGGTPTERKNEYAQYSAYTSSLANGGNAQYLTKTPVRIYCEPDTAWYKINRGYDYQDLNASCSIPMVQKLQKAGNKYAQVIITTNKGYRRDGRRHPHSWSLLDADDCVKWFRQIHIIE